MLTCLFIILAIPTGLFILVNVLDWASKMTVKFTCSKCNKIWEEKMSAGAPCCFGIVVVKCPSCQSNFLFDEIKYDIIS